MIKHADVADLDPPPAARATGPRVPLDQVTYDHIKALILSNQVRAGNKLTHQRLAELLSVSRTPVRQALERLYQEGYVIRIPARGYFVAEINSHEARDLYEMRQALEIFALRLALAKGVGRADLERLVALQRVYGALVAENGTLERVKADEAFHLALAALSGNRYLVDSLTGVFERLALKRRMEGYWPGRGKRGSAGLKEHERLLRAIRQNRPEEAEAALREHLQEAWVHFEAHLLRLATL